MRDRHAARLARRPAPTDEFSPKLARRVVPLIMVPTDAAAAAAATETFTADCILLAPLVAARGAVPRVNLRWAFRVRCTHPVQVANLLKWSLWGVENAPGVFTQ